MQDVSSHSSRIAALRPWHGTVREGCFANFLGAMTALEFVAKHPPSNAVITASGGGESTAALPTPKDGELFFEFVSLLAAVKAAEERFVMLELGGGYAARSVDAALALRRFNPLPAFLVVVEAEPTHFAWAKRHFAVNGLDPEQHWLINAAVSDRNVPVPFLTGAGYYFNQVLGAAEANFLFNAVQQHNLCEVTLRNLLQSGEAGLSIPMGDTGGTRFDIRFVNAVPLNDLLRPVPHVDLLDMDIQGAEVEVLRPAMAAIDEKVKRVHIGTHGQDLHEATTALFAECGWNRVFDFAPKTIHRTSGGSFETQDGILAFANPKLLSSQQSVA